MSSCNTFPTLTRTDEITSESVTTIVSSVPTTLPPTTTTFTTIVGTLTATLTSVIPGQISTITLTTTSTTQFTTTQTTTLFDTSCLPGSTPPPTPIPSSPTPASPSVPLSTQPNGSIVTTSTTETVTASLPPSQANGSGNGNGSNDGKLAAIVGGSVGGGVGLLVALLLAWFFLRMRRKRSVWDGVFNEDDATQKNYGRTPNIELLEPDVIPQPYPLPLSPTSPSSTTPATPYRDPNVALADPIYLGHNPNLVPSSSITDYFGHYHPGYGSQPTQGYPPRQPQPYGGIGQDGTATPPYLYPGPYAQHQGHNDSIGRASGQGYPYNRNQSLPNPYEGQVPLVGPQSVGVIQDNSNSGSTTSVATGAAGVATERAEPAPRRDVKNPAGPGFPSHPGPTRVPVVHLDGGRYQEQEAPVASRAEGEPDTGSGEGSRDEELGTGGTSQSPPAYTES